MKNSKKQIAIKRMEILFNNALSNAQNNPGLAQRQAEIAKKIESETEILMQMENSSLSKLISKIQPDEIIGLTTQGQKTTFEKLTHQIKENSCILIGGFQKGHFNKETEKIIETSFSIHDSSLEAHLVASRIVYEYEKTIFI